MQDMKWRLGNLAAMCLVAAAIAAFWYEHYGPITLEVQGRLIDASTGAPIEGAWAIVASRAGNSSIGGETGGCSRGSAVLRTDRDGRFAHSALIPSDRRADYNGFTLYAYHPDYMVPVKIDLRPVVVRIVSENGRVERTYPTLPFRYEQGSGEVTLAMKPRQSSEWDELQNIYEIWDRACLIYHEDRGHSTLLKEFFFRTLELNCDNNRPEALADFSVIIFFRSAEALLTQITHHLRKDYSGADTDYGTARRQYVTQDVLRDFPWDPSRLRPARPATAQEKSDLCAFYSQPMDFLINKDGMP